MDLILQKKLAKLQLENAQLKQELQKLHELSPETYVNYLAAKADQVGDDEWRMGARSQSVPVSQDFERVAERRKFEIKKLGIQRAKRLLMKKLKDKKD